MIIKIIFLFIVTFNLMACVFFYRRSKIQQLIAIEQNVAKTLEVRSHKLCITACEIDCMPDTEQKYQADKELREKLHQYMDDFESEVAERLKTNKVQHIKAYGGIKLL